MIKIPIGQIVKEIVDEKSLRAVDVAAELGLSRTAIYQSYAKKEMSPSEIERWATALGVTAEYIHSKRKAALDAIQGNREGQDNSYLLEHLSKLEETFNAQLSRLSLQLEVKDRQIEGLQNTVNVLLGKSEDVTILMTTLGQALAKTSKLSPVISAPASKAARA